MSMTENEAKILLCQMYLPHFDEEEKQALTIAIQALEENQNLKDNGAFTSVELAQLAAMQMRLKKYEAIGTVEEFKALKEQQTSLQKTVEDIVENGWDENDLSMWEDYDSAFIDGMNYVSDKLAEKLDWQ